MIEPVMYFGIGFLVTRCSDCCSSRWFISPCRAPDHAPFSKQRRRCRYAEIRADKDQLRAEFAMSTRRLELSVAQMKTKTNVAAGRARQEGGRHQSAQKRARREDGHDPSRSRPATKPSASNCAPPKKNSRSRTAPCATWSARSPTRKPSWSSWSPNWARHPITSDSQRVELAALRTQVEAMKVGVADCERTVKDIEQRRNRERSESEATAAESTAAREKLGSLRERTTDLERQLLLQTTEAEVLHKRVQELETKLGEQGRAIAERDYQIEKLRNDAEAARQTEADLRSELASSAAAAPSPPTSSVPTSSSSKRSSLSRSRSATSCSASCRS